MSTPINVTFILAGFTLCVLTPNAQGQESASPASSPMIPAVEPTMAPAVDQARIAPMPIAVGIGAGLQQRQNYGSIGRSNTIPELFGVTYRRAFDIPRLYWRFGARIGYSGLEQADVPSGVEVSEHDLRITGEAGFVYDNVVIPSVVLGLGAQYRYTNFASALPELDLSSLDSHEVQPILYLQTSLGFPFGKGVVVLEPYTRYERIRRDDRSQWMFGMDLSVQLPR